MTKVIENIELLDKLQPYLWETESTISVSLWTVNLKTLTLEDAIDLLPIWYIFNKSSTWYTFHNLGVGWNQVFSWKTKLEPIEKMLEYLIDNNLLKDD